jgi:plasmid stabilization system protein ParE
MANVVLLPGAELDYQEGYVWYHARSERAAENFEAAIEHALSLIADDPEQWPFCDDRHRLYILRRYPYSVVYRLEGDTVLVVAIAHARRRLGYWKQRN